ncbi:hypothetical protein JXK06_03585 [Patescibacteria group bacterium]|nr:hypothetical protein [Patescibacteria group bacterium]
MTKKKAVVEDLFEKYVKGTKEKELVILESAYICRLTYAVFDALGFNDYKVYVNTKALKHLYDKKPAEEFYYIVKNLYKFIKYPDWIYKNRTSKRGEFCLVKEIHDFKYLCSLEFCEDELEGKIYVVTAFRIRDEAYLKKYELLWSWKGDRPSS